MDLWSSFIWRDVGIASLAGLVLGQLNIYLTSAVLHRGMTHQAIVYPRRLERVVAIWLWLTVCVPPLTWIAAHKHHHVHADTKDDPHAPGLKGVWRVLLFTWWYVTYWSRSNWEYACQRYLRQFRNERFLHFLDHPTVANINFYGQMVVSVLLGPVTISFWVARIVPYMVVSGSVNSVGHFYGKRPFDNQATDADRFWQKLLGWVNAGETLGHNYHHRYPGRAWFHPGGFDPGFWFATRVLGGVILYRSGTLSPER
jgi:Fatty-acid desaturase